MRSGWSARGCRGESLDALQRKADAAARDFARFFEATQRRGGDLATKGWRKTMRISKDDVLEALGLQTRSSAGWIGPAVIGFGVGALVGAMLSRMLVPRTMGEEAMRPRAGRPEGTPPGEPSGTRMPSF